MNARLEAFSDAVFAFALTLLIVDVRLPAMARIRDTGELWLALRGLEGPVFAFLLSFGVILITWVNHHNALKLVSGSSAPFVYANGLLLLSVVCIPFTTSLWGAFVLTDHGSPAVALYDAVLAAQAIGWLAVTSAALRQRLCDGTQAVSTTRALRRRALGAAGLYSALALLALRLPFTVAVITTATWIFWLGQSLRAPQAVAGAA